MWSFLGVKIFIELLIQYVFSRLDQVFTLFTQTFRNNSFLSIHQWGICNFRKLSNCSKWFLLLSSLSDEEVVKTVKDLDNDDQKDSICSGIFFQSTTYSLENVAAIPCPELKSCSSIFVKWLTLNIWISWRVIPFESWNLLCCGKIKSTF